VANPGLFFTTMAIMLILGRALGGKLLDLYSREKVILPCLFIYILSMVILTFSKTLPMFILVAADLGDWNAFLGPALIADALDRVGSSAGPAMGTFTAISDVGLTTGPVIMGIVLQSTSYPDYVPVPGSCRGHQSWLFPFFCEQEGAPLMIPAVLCK